MADTETARPTEDQAWAAFWAIWAPALVRLHAEGKLKESHELAA